MEGIGSRWQPDGSVIYRRALDDGALVAILPATCRRGLHSLAGVYRSTLSEREGSPRNDGKPSARQTISLSCPTCSAVPHPQHAWSLRTGGHIPDRAVLDDSYYTELHTRLLAADEAKRQLDLANIERERAERAANPRPPSHRTRRGRRY